MEQKLLITAPNANVYYDAVNDWLYLDWHGEVTLDSMRLTCLQTTRCFLTKRYKRILNDNTGITRVTPDVAPWLAKDFLPYLWLGGIEYVAWVCSPNIHIQNDTEAAIAKLTSPVVVLFDDMATAYEWLSAAKFQSPVMLHSTLSFMQIMGALKDRILSLGGRL